MKKFKLVYYSGQRNEIIEREIRAERFETINGALQFTIDTKPCCAFSNYISVEEIE